MVGEHCKVVSTVQRMTEIGREVDYKTGHKFFPSLLPHPYRVCPIKRQSLFLYPLDLAGLGLCFGQCDISQ